MSSQRKEKDWLVPVGVVLIVVAIVLLLWFFMRGQTTVTGGYPENISSVSLNCKSSGLEYPFFTSNKPDGKSATINATFSDDALQSIALIYTLSYNEAGRAERNETINSIAMSEAISKANLPLNLLVPNFSHSEASSQMSIYASGENITKVKEFFLISGSAQKLEDYQKNYVAQGFECSIKN